MLTREEIALHVLRVMLKKRTVRADVRPMLTETQIKVCFETADAFLKEAIGVSSSAQDSGSKVSAEYPNKAGGSANEPVVAKASFEPEYAHKEWLIYNTDYREFWGPAQCGYTGLWGAGLYTKKEARLLAANPERHDQAHHITEYRDQIMNMRGAFERLSAALEGSAR